MEIALVICFENTTRNRFVMARHRERGWEIPGGRIEPGESPEEAALREFAEEIGHRLDNPRLVMDQMRPRGRFYVVEGVLGKKLHGGDGTVAEWRLVRSIEEVSPLAFQDDPYEEMGKAVGRALRGLR